MLPSLLVNSLTHRPVDSLQTHPRGRKAVEGAGVRTVILQPLYHPPVQAAGLFSVFWPYVVLLLSIVSDVVELGWTRVRRFADQQCPLPVSDGGPPAVEEIGVMVSLEGPGGDRHIARSFRCVAAQ